MVDRPTAAARFEQPASSHHAAGAVIATPAIAAFCTLLWVLTRVYPPEAWRPFLLVPSSFAPVSLLTAPFIHLTPFHLGFNLVLLALFGPPLERRLGTRPFLLLYLGSGVLAALLHLSIAVIFQVGLSRPASGASGALAGLMGAYTVLYAPRSQAFGLKAIRAALGSFSVDASVLIPVVVAWIFGELLQGSISLLYGRDDVAHWAHIGGYLFGLIIPVAMGQGTDRMAGEQLLSEGQQLLGRGRFPEAVRVLERAWSLQPHDPPTILSLARAKQAVGDGETARELLAASLEQEVRDRGADQAVRLYLESRTLAPRLQLSGEAYYRLAGWLGERGAWSEACTALERVGAASPKQARGEDDPLASAALFRAAEVALTRLEQPERAITLLERLLHDYPKSQWRALAERSLRSLQSRETGQ
jgi:membrane associated rhomboid family serine protease